MSFWPLLPIMLCIGMISPSLELNLVALRREVPCMSADGVWTVFENEDILHESVETVHTCRSQYRSRSSSFLPFLCPSLSIAARTFYSCASFDGNDDCFRFSSLVSLKCKMDSTSVRRGLDFYIFNTHSLLFARTCVVHISTKRNDLRIVRGLRAEYVLNIQ